MPIYHAPAGYDHLPPQTQTPLATPVRVTDTYWSQALDMTEGADKRAIAHNWLQLLNAEWMIGFAEDMANLMTPCRKMYAKVRPFIDPAVFEHATFDGTLKPFVQMDTEDGTIFFEHLNRIWLQPVEDIDAEMCRMVTNLEVDANYFIAHPYYGFICHLLWDRVELLGNDAPASLLDAAISLSISCGQMQSSKQPVHGNTLAQAWHLLTLRSGLDVNWQTHRKERADIKEAFAGMNLEIKLRHFTTVVKKASTLDIAGQYILEENTFLNPSSTYPGDVYAVMQEWLPELKGVWETYGALNLDIDDALVAAFAYIAAGEAQVGGTLPKNITS